MYRLRAISGMPSLSTKGKILCSRQVPTSVAEGPSGIQRQIVSVINEISVGYSPIGIGIGIPGQINPDTGMVFSAPNLKWKNVPFGSSLSLDSQLKVVLTNDVRAATIGEWKYGAGVGCVDFVCLFIGTGLGGGIVSGGNLLEGSTHSSGEIGHMIIDPHGPQCTCGSKGCLESFISGWAIAQSAKELMMKSDGPITAKTVVESAIKGDKIAIQIIDRAVDALIIGCVNIMNILNPKHMIIGGSVAQGIPHLIPRLQEGIHKLVLAANSDVTITFASLGNQAGVVGAAALALEHL